ncbi:MAG: hypothetical protein MJE63_17545 [Proteobacteria bacterium]|nr:hypothetical protein [Pseudomonadota bacterium]
MNAEERRALKRALESKENWKHKAQERKKQIRLLELRIRDLEHSRNQWKGKYFKGKNQPKPEEKEDKKQSLTKPSKIDRKKN